MWNFNNNNNNTNNVFFYVLFVSIRAHDSPLQVKQLHSHTSLHYETRNKKLCLLYLCHSLYYLFIYCLHQKTQNKQCFVSESPKNTNQTHTERKLNNNTPTHTCTHTCMHTHHNTTQRTHTHHAHVCTRMHTHR